MERSEDWLEEAKGDLRHGKSDLDGGFYNWACFSAQQSAEKALKAVFQKLGAEAWGPSVGDLLEELAKKYEVSEDLQDAALELDKAYIPTRYPDAHPTGSAKDRYTKSEARRLLDHAERIVKFSSDLLSEI